ncbi:hypothetical protein CFIMG_004901RA [Ceratocystis fimbriata CBS 114723]|uniref:Rho-GAP domain-containing protein n=1 Tax=Ceratocystis fimbriata CBS 114723 TaxID=1035309 RepID=A0A2C5X2T5_9PEZI|nr:hypothetical protein CFIMG_004901RA [Ceratocystis fimbriata CBS 114723]
MSRQHISPIASPFPSSQLDDDDTKHKADHENPDDHVRARRIRMLRPRTAPSSSPASTSASLSGSYVPGPLYRGPTDSATTGLQQLQQMSNKNNRSTPALPVSMTTASALNQGQGYVRGLGLGLRSKSKPQLRPSETWASLNRQENGEDRDEFVARFNEAAAKLDGVHMLEAENFRALQCEPDAPEQPRRSLLARLFRASTSSPSPKQADTGLKLTKKSVGDYMRPLVKKNMPRYVGLDAMIRISGVSVLSLPYPFLSRPVMLPSCLHETGVYLLEHYMGVPGLFRVPGSYRVVNELYEYYLYAHHGGHDISETIRCEGLPSHIKTGPHDIASAFKRFLNAIPGGILGSVALFEALEEVTYQHNHSSLPRDEQTKVTANLIALALGAVNYQPRRELICGVFGLLALMAAVAKKSVAMGNGEEQLGAQGLGIVFGPLLTGSTPSTETGAHLSGLDSASGSGPSGSGATTPVTVDLEATKRLVEQARNANDIASLLISLWRDIVPELKNNRVLEVRIARPFVSNNLQQPQQQQTRSNQYRPFSPSTQVSTSFFQQSDNSLSQNPSRIWRASPIPELSSPRETPRSTSPEPRSRPQSPLKSARKLFPKAFSSREKNLAAALPHSVHIRRVPSYENSDIECESKPQPRPKHRERIDSRIPTHSPPHLQASAANMPVPLSYIRRIQQQQQDSGFKGGDTITELPNRPQHQLPARVPINSPRPFAFNFDDEDTTNNSTAPRVVSPNVEVNREARVGDPDRSMSPMESFHTQETLKAFKRREVPTSYNRATAHLSADYENRTPIAYIDGHFQSQSPDQQKQEIMNKPQTPIKAQKQALSLENDIKANMVTSEVSMVTETSSTTRTPGRALRTVRSLGALFHRHHGHSLSPVDAVPTLHKGKSAALTHKKLAELEKEASDDVFNTSVDSIAAASTTAVADLDGSHLGNGAVRIKPRHRRLRRVLSNIRDTCNMDQSNRSLDAEIALDCDTSGDQKLHESKGTPQEDAMVSAIMAAVVGPNTEISKNNINFETAAARPEKRQQQPIIDKAANGSEVFSKTTMCRESDTSNVDTIESVESATSSGSVRVRQDKNSRGSTTISTATSEASTKTIDTSANKERSGWKMSWRGRTAQQQRQSGSSMSLVRPSLEEVRKLQQEVDSLYQEVAQAKNQENMTVHALKAELRECHNERKIWKVRAQRAEGQLGEMLRREEERERERERETKRRDVRKVSAGSSESQYSIREE